MRSQAPAKVRVSCRLLRLLSVRHVFKYMPCFNKTIYHIFIHFPYFFGLQKGAMTCTCMETHFCGVSDSDAMLEILAKHVVWSRSSGLTKQLVLDNLSDVLFILDEVGSACVAKRMAWDRHGTRHRRCFRFLWLDLTAWQLLSATVPFWQVTDNGVIMETDDEKISARIKMIDETEVTQSAQARHGMVWPGPANAWVSWGESATICNTWQHDQYGKFSAI